MKTAARARACTMRLVEAPWVLPIDRPPIEDGAVLVNEAGVIVAVGARSEVRAIAPRGAARVEARGVLLPSFTNAHLHLELSALRGAVPGGAGLVPWVRTLLAKRPSLDAETTQAALRAALEELRSCGTGALGDVSSGLDGGDVPLDAPFEGVRFHEALSARPEDASRALDETRARAAHGTSGPLRPALAAHSPATCSEELLRAIAAHRSRDGDIPFSMHLAEDPAERELLAKGEGPWANLLAERGLPLPRIATGISPSLCAERVGLLGPRTLAVHCVDLDARDIGILARSGATAVVCPRSNRYLGVGRAPVAELIAAGVRIALGTDSLASSPSLSVLEEAAALPIPPERAIEAATRGGALALGLPDRGTIAPGQRPGLIAIDVAVGRRRPEAALIEQPRAQVVWT